MDIIDPIRTFLANDLRIADARALDANVPLVARGILDSLELMQVVMFLETEFGITIDETEILPSNLRSLAAMEVFVRRKRADAEMARAM